MEFSLHMSLFLGGRKAIINLFLCHSFQLEVPMVMPLSINDAMNAVLVDL